MYYPDDFKGKAKALYPYWTLLHEALDQNSPRVGELLSTAWSKGIRLVLLKKFKTKHVLGLHVKHFLVSGLICSEARPI